jgi:leucyl-tRNA synthetase
LDKKTRDKVENRQIQAELFDEKEFLSSELSSMGKKEFGVEITVYSESDSGIYDPKCKARHARPLNL